MPRPRKPTKSPREQLADLPHRPDLTLIGGKQALPIYIRDQGKTVQPQVTLWLEPERGYIYGFGLISPTQTSDDGVSQALDTLYQAIAQPGAAPGGMPTGPAKDHATGRAEDHAKDHLPNGALPATLLVNDAALAEAARAALGPLGVTVEHRASLPPFDAAVAELSESLGGDPNAAPEPFSWAIDPALLPPLYKAAIGLWRRAPWEYLPDHPPVVVTLGAHGPRPGVETLYASIMGLAEEVYGVAFYTTAEALDRIVAHGEARAERVRVERAAIPEEEMSVAIDLLRQAGMPVDQMAPEALRAMVGSALTDEASAEEIAEVQRLTEDSLLVSFDPQDEVDPTYVEWLTAHGLPTASRDAIPTFVSNGASGAHSPPNAREVAALTLTLEALNQFFSKHRQQLGSMAGSFETVSDQVSVKGTSGPVPVSLSFTPSQPQSRQELLDQLQEMVKLASHPLAGQEPKKRATALGRATLYRFQVKLDWQKSVWRRIELRGDQTLHDLHNAIQEAFGWDDDHLYAFYLSGIAWDRDTAYESPVGDGHHADRYRLERLPLTVGQRILYLFDFGDRLEHSVKLEAIVPGGVTNGVTYPRITERRGANLPQYRELDEDEDGDEE